MSKGNKKSVRLKDIFLLQLVVVIYTMSGIVAKLASYKKFLSVDFIVLYVAEIVILGVYALLWQQVIKKFELSIAYANRSIALLWSMIWAVIFFQEQISIKNIIGVLIVMTGTIIINTDEYK